MIQNESQNTKLCNKVVVKIKMSQTMSAGKNPKDKILQTIDQCKLYITKYMLCMLILLL